ncbi:DUF6538 domain-containing protein [Aurantimonas sp. A3-2-R12]|uniref:DUF6538 domain-containing protein n=1 Tax=unclassified Aurantimonas TaxID=2638230 RepID=UPI003FA4C19A
MGVCYLQDSLAPFVTRRGSVFWFRKPVPVDLVPRLDRSDIRRSLRTSNRRTAETRRAADGPPRSLDGGARLCTGEGDVPSPVRLLGQPHVSQTAFQAGRRAARRR